MLFVYRKTFKNLTVDRYKFLVDDVIRKLIRDDKIKCVFVFLCLVDLNYCHKKRWLETFLEKKDSRTSQNEKKNQETKVAARQVVDAALERNRVKLMECCSKKERVLR